MRPGSQLLFALTKLTSRRGMSPFYSSIELRETLWTYAIVCACVLTGSLAFAAYALTVTHQATLLDNAVVLMRHGDAPGRNEPLQFDLSDCSTQRNLSDKGRSEAKETGNIFRAQNLDVRSVISSRWCRTRDTATLLGLSSVQMEPAFDNLDLNKNHSVELLQAEQNIIQQWHGPGMMVVVTHSSNIRALSGLELVPGSMLIAKTRANGDLEYKLSPIALKDMFL